MNRDDENEAKRIVHSLLPQRETRELYLKMLVESLNHANSFGSDKWGAYYKPNRVWLLVGGFVTFSIEREIVWLALYTQLSEASEKLERLLTETSSWRWDEDDYPRYKIVPSRNGYYTPLKNHSEVWPIIRELHFEFIRRAAATYKKLKKPSQAKHSPALLNYLGKELGEFIPEPIYEQIERPNYFTLPEGISEDVSFYEGGKQQRTGDVYERNPKARRACIKYHGTRCKSCDLDFRESYGEVGKGLIHVHHLKPLSEIGEQYKIDPIHDLVPVCPNCHTIIHKRNPPYTVEQVKEFLKRSKV